MDINEQTSKRKWYKNDSKGMLSITSFQIFIVKKKEKMNLICVMFEIQGDRNNKNIIQGRLIEIYSYIMDKGRDE